MKVSMCIISRKTLTNYFLLLSKISNNSIILNTVYLQIYILLLDNCLEKTYDY